MTAIAADAVLDCTGMPCPMPILKSRKAIDAIRVGQVLKVISTDPGAASDIPAWTEKTGHQLLASEQEGDRYIFYVKKTK